MLMKAPTQQPRHPGDHLHRCPFYTGRPHTALAMRPICDAIALDTRLLPRFVVPASDCSWAGSGSEE